MVSEDHGVCLSVISYPQVYKSESDEILHWLDIMRVGESFNGSISNHCFYFYFDLFDLMRYRAPLMLLPSSKTLSIASWGLKSIPLKGIYVEKTPHYCQYRHIKTYFISQKRRRKVSLISIGG